MNDKFKLITSLIAVIFVVGFLVLCVYAIVTDWESIEQWLRKPLSQYQTTDAILLGLILSMFFSTNVTNKIDKNVGN